MLAPQRRSRRRPFYFVVTGLLIYFIISHGPPIFTPTTVSGPATYVERASQWATSWRSFAPPHIGSSSLSPSLIRPFSSPALPPNLSSPEPSLTYFPYDNQQELQSTPLTSKSTIWPRIRQASMVFDGDTDSLREIYIKGLELHVRHGDRWGVPTHMLEESLVEDRSFFNKPAWLAHIIMGELSRPVKQRSEWIVWFDADTIILNPTISYEIFLPPSDFSDKHILATRDANGLNTGMLFLRVSPWTLSFLTLTLSLPLSDPTMPLPFFDKSALDTIALREGYKQHVLFQPRKWWNRYQNDADGDEKGSLLLHFAGSNTVTGGTKGKRDIMMGYFDKIERDPLEWQKTAKEIGLEDEIKEYWDRLRKARKVLDKAKGLVAGIGGGKEVKGKEDVGQEPQVLIGKMKEKDEKGRETTMKAEAGIEAKFFRLVDLVLRGADEKEEMELGIKALEAAMKEG